MTTSPTVNSAQVSSSDTVMQERLLKMEKFRLMFFSIRHLVGVAMVFAITLQAFSLGAAVFAVVLGSLSLIYGIFAFVSWQKLHRQYRRRLATIARLKQTG